MTKLFEIQVYGHGKDYPLRLHYSNRRKMQETAFALRCEGFKVTGEYDHTVSLNMTPTEAIESAKALLG